ncbi:MAG: hypothetical protein M9892_00635 [Bacteroidetes bacterium]|nr:hypothetical protein [Bacteroidota bacterium]
MRDKNKSPNSFRHAKAPKILANNCGFIYSRNFSRLYIDIYPLAKTTVVYYITFDTLFLICQSS